MTLFMPILYVCAVMATNPNHCEKVIIPEVTATVEACTRILREQTDLLLAVKPFPYPQLHSDILIRGRCSVEVLYETIVRAD